MKRVFVGLSGGVDSSVAGMLLKQQGYKVIGVYMKNWSQDLPGMKCPWEEDYQDAKRVAVQLGIDFKVYDFEKEYRHRVVDYMIREYKAGRTPNPDVMCNQEVKFKLFLETALEEGADYIATGHYAKVLRGMPSQNQNNELRIKNKGEPKTHNSYPINHNSVSLAMAKDTNKDQTYFIYRISKEALGKILFPLGDLTKQEVRQIAKKHGLITAGRKESMGICFVGKVGIKDFLSQYVSKKSGKIVDQNGKFVGEHEGAIFYTIGQRHGLNIGGGLPYYVTGKNMKKNEVLVTTDLQDDKLWSKQMRLTNVHWLNGETQNNELRIKNKGEPKTHNSYPILHDSAQRLAVRTRHRAPLVPIKQLSKLSTNQWNAELEEEVRALTPGQSAVFYSGDRVLGGGIVV